MKQSQRNADYNLCLKNKLHLVAKEFGLSPEQFAEHVKDEFSSHDILQEQEDPETFAAGFITDQEIGLSLELYMFLGTTHTLLFNIVNLKTDTSSTPQNVF